MDVTNYVRSNQAAMPTGVSAGPRQLDRGTALAERQRSPEQEEALMMKRRTFVTSVLAGGLISPLAAAQDNGLKRKPELLSVVDCEDGVWRCHSAFECTAVCPSFVDPARRIMDLREQVVSARFRKLFGKA